MIPFQNENEHLMDYYNSESSLSFKIHILYELFWCKSSEKFPQPDSPNTVLFSEIYTGQLVMSFKLDRISYYLLRLKRNR